MDLNSSTSPGPENIQFARQFSYRFRNSLRLSSSRTLTREDLEQGASRYYEKNKSNFGQVVAVEDDDLPIFSIPTALSVHLQQTSFVHHLESGDEPKDDVPITFDPAPTNTKRKRSTSKVADVGGGRSRFETIILEQNWWNTYKLLFLASFATNLVGLVLAATGYFSYAKAKASLFSVGNILMVVIVRNEVFLRILFWLVVKLLGHAWIPVWIKSTVTALLQSVGGIHSGCGCAAIMWLVYAIVHSVPVHTHPDSSRSILIVAAGILFLLLLSTLAAFPVARHAHHNIFERVHRFAGWISLVLIWAYIVMSAFWDPESQSYRVNAAGRLRLVKMQILWLSAVTTVMIILPWLTVRKVPVVTLVPPSKLNSLIQIEGGVKAGLLARISPAPFSEWHAFGLISDGKSTRTILAGAVGDFTKSLVENPPSSIWVRTFHFAGLPYLTRLYERAVLAATGSGICVFLSFLMQPTRSDVHVVWIAKNIRENYGEDIWNVVSNVPQRNLTMIDTAVSGRPKTKELVVTKAKEWNAQVVIVTSNPKGTNEIVNGCKDAGIPAFGPIWDS